jgi:hypothetical protein
MLATALNDAWWCVGTRAKLIMLTGVKNIHVAASESEVVVVVVVVVVVEVVEVLALIQGAKQHHVKYSY